MALEHVAQGQARFMTPGVAPDPRGVLLGRYCLLLFPTLEGVVSWLRLYSAEGSLDELISGLEDPRPYLKLDTQGYDVEVFQGAGERVSDFVGMQSELALMQIYEGMPRLPEALAVYEAAGFDVAAMYPVSRQGKTARVLEFDCVMVRGSVLKP